ncbi:MAG: winged helix-turn-helix domain-containing protein [bacterium]|nr:winged helix-turn-helix domain-containing protein [bacterium]
MLEDIITSKVRIKLLRLLIEESQPLHVREIVRRAKEEINAVRRELAQMEKRGMVKKEQRGNRLYYFFKQSYPYYFDLLAIVNKSFGLGGAIIKNREKFGKIKWAMLTGNFVRRRTPSSEEVDLLIVGEINMGLLSSLVRDEEVRIEREINYTAMKEEEFNFRKSRHDPFIVKILSGLRTMLVGDEEELLK